MNRLIGIILVAISAALFGTFAILGRYAYAEGMDAPTILFLRFSLAAVVLAPLLAVRREPISPAPTLVRLVGMCALGYVGQAMSYLTALKYASSGLVALLLYLYPIFVAILSATVLHERLTRPTASGLLMLAAGLHWPASAAGWVTIGAIVIVATVVPVVTFLGGLRRIGPTHAALLSTLEPAVTVLLAATLLGESLKPLSLLGGGLIILAVGLLTRQELRR